MNRLIYLTEWNYFENHLQKSNTKMRVFDFKFQQRMTYIWLSTHNTYSQRAMHHRKTEAVVVVVAAANASVSNV